MNDEGYEKTVWTLVSESLNSDYVHRCSKCGKFGRTLRRHWFFTGLYCYQCIMFKLYACTPHLLEKVEEKE